MWILDGHICGMQDIIVWKEMMLTEMSAIPCMLPGYLSWILPRTTFHPAILGFSVGLLAVIKTQKPSCLQIHALDLSTPNPTSNMHLSPGQLAQPATALPEKGPSEPQGIERRGWIIPSIQRPRGSFFFSKCFQFPLGELLLGIFFLSVFPWMWLRLWSRKWGGGHTDGTGHEPLKNVSHHFKTQVELIKSKFQQCVQSWAGLKTHFRRFDFKTIPLCTCTWFREVSCIQ